MSGILPRTLRRQSKMIGSEHQMYRSIRLKTNRHEYGVMAQNNICSPQMSIAYSADDRLTSGDGSGDIRSVESRVSRRYDKNGNLRRKPESSQRRAPVISRAGVRASSAFLLMAVVAAVMFGAFLYGRSMISARQKELTALRAQLERSVSTCASLQNQVDTAQSEIKVAYNAKNLGLVSSKSLPVTLLYAPDGEISPSDSAALPASGSFAVITR